MALHQEEDSEDRKDKIDSVFVPSKDACKVLNLIRARKINLFFGRLSPKIIWLPLTFRKLMDGHYTANPSEIIPAYVRSFIINKKEVQNGKLFVIYFLLFYSKVF